MPAKFKPPHPNPTGDEMTEEQRKAQIAALEVEKEGYERRGLAERAAQVQAELDRLTGEMKPKRVPRKTKG
jgi:hypothetical protein